MNEKQRRSHQHETKASDVKYKNMEISLERQTLIDACFIISRTWVECRESERRNLLIEPSACSASDCTRVEGDGKKKLSDVRVSYLLNNYANKAICRHETFPFAFFLQPSLSPTPCSPNSDFIIQLHVVHISGSFFFLSSNCRAAVTRGRGKKEWKFNLIWLI